MNEIVRNLVLGPMTHWRKNDTNINYFYYFCLQVVIDEDKVLRLDFDHMANKN